MQRSSAWRVLFGALCAVSFFIATNVAAAVLPSAVSRYRWLAWFAVGIFVVGTIINEFRMKDTGNPGRSLAPPRDHARLALLDLEEKFWIHSVLERSLYQVARLELGLTTMWDAPHPWQMSAVQPGHSPAKVPPGTPMAVIFRDLGGEMLLVGEPGSGKTTTLLELLRDLIGQARGDFRAPIPILLMLASWADRRDPLGEWVVREVHERYGIPPLRTQEWLARDEAVLLLDGLDEVAAAHRADCVVAINDYRRDNGVTPIAVTCRTEEYSRLAVSLRTYGTASIEPLSKEQVEGFLGHLPAGARAIAGTDPAIRNSLTSPLMLSIFAITFGGRTGLLPAPVQAAAGGSTRLLATYTREMLLRRRDRRHSPAATLRVLVRIADALQRSERTVFTVELLSPSWNRKAWSRQLCRVIPSAVWLSILLVTVGAAGYVLYGWPGILAGFAMAGVGALCPDVRVEIGIVLDEEFMAKRAGREALAEYISRRPLTTRVLENIFPFDLLFGFQRFDQGATRFSHHEKRLLRRAGFLMRPWYWQPRKGIESSAWPFLLAAASVVGTGAAFLVSGSVRLHVAYGVAGACWVIFVGIVGIRAKGSVVGLPGKPGRELPTPYARSVVQFGARTALAAGATATVLAGCLAVLIGPATSAVRLATLIAVSTTLLVMCWIGGQLTVEQATLRLTLAVAHLFPYPSVHFLEYARQCLFLQSAGNGHIFIHGSMRDFLAEFRYQEMLSRELPIWNTRDARDQLWAELIEALGRDA
jgi:NACHT domain